MQSINYITTWAGWITGLATAGIILSCIVSGFGYYVDGADISEILKKIGKRIRAGIILITLTAIISFLKRYWT